MPASMHPNLPTALPPYDAPPDTPVSLLPMHTSAKNGHAAVAMPPAADPRRTREQQQQGLSSSRNGWLGGCFPHHIAVHTPQQRWTASSPNQAGRQAKVTGSNTRQRVKHIAYFYGAGRRVTHAGRPQTGV